MELFQQLRHLYVNVGNDVRQLQETVAAHPTGIGSSCLQADKLFNEPHSDVKLQEEKVGAKIKELQVETHFGEVVTCCSAMLNDSLAQLDRLELHLQKYSVQPIGNARQRCKTKIEPSLSSNESEPPSTICNPLSTEAPMATEPLQTHAKDWPMSYNIAPTPKLSDFGISESFAQRLDELTAAILNRTQLSHASAGQGHASAGQGHASTGQGHAGVGQGQTGDGTFTSATDPSIDRPCCQSLSTNTDTTSSFQNLTLDASAIRGNDQDQGDIVSKKKKVATSNLDCEQSSLIQSVNTLTLASDEYNFCSTLPLHGASFPHTDVGVMSGHLESSSNSKSTWNVHDLPMPSPPQLSDMARNALDFHAREKGIVLLRSVKKELDLSPSTSLLSEQTVNILRQLQLSKISSLGIKLEPHSTEKIGENVPPDHQSTRKSHAAVAGHAAKRCLDLGAGSKTRDAASSRIVSQNVVSTEELVPKRHTAVTDQTSNVERSSAKSQPCVTETPSVLGYSDGTNKSKKVTSSSGFGSDDWTCPQIPYFSPDDYENLVPAVAKAVVSRDRINYSIGKANDVLLTKMLDGGSMTLTVDDLSQAGCSNADLFLKLMSLTGRLARKTEHGMAEYSLVK